MKSQNLHKESNMIGDVEFDQMTQSIIIELFESTCQIDSIGNISFSIDGYSFDTSINDLKDTVKTYNAYFNSKK